MSYRALSTEEAAQFIARNSVQSADIPPMGLIVSDGQVSVLVFRKQTGELVLVDVTDQVPAHFGQKYPAQETFWSDFAWRITSPGGYIKTWEELTTGKSVIAAANELLAAVIPPLSEAANAAFWVLGLLVLGLFLWRSK